MYSKYHDQVCPSCGANTLKVYESRPVTTSESRDRRSSEFARSMSVDHYIRRRRKCTTCAHRFTTIELSLECISSAAEELNALREQLLKYEQAMQLINCAVGHELA